MHVVKNYSENKSYIEFFSQFFCTILILPTEGLVAWSTINCYQSIIFLYKVTQDVNHAGQVTKPRSAKRGRLNLHWFHWKALA